jgi:nitroimidazol reductase NimA-like FMN-containing flavoprotein (pyridoxamine 5'-phosphate oxidase superfamily)
MKLNKTVAKLIALERVCRVATAGKAHVPHLVPVCHVVDRGKIYFASEKGAHKVSNVKENPRVTVTVDLYSEAWSNLKGVMVQGSAKVVEPAAFRRIRKLLYEKYPQYPSEAAIGERDSVIIEVSPAHVFSWGLDEKSG